MKGAHITKAPFMYLVKLRLIQNNLTVDDTEDYISTAVQEGGISNL